jgi:hypothetical protein
MLCDDDMLLFRGYKSLTHMNEIWSNPVQPARKDVVSLAWVVRVKTSISRDNG